MDHSASAATKDAARNWRRRSCTPPRFSSTLPEAEMLELEDTLNIHYRVVNKKRFTCIQTGIFQYIMIGLRVRFTAVDCMRIVSFCKQ